MSTPKPSSSKDVQPVAGSSKKIKEELIEDNTKIYYMDNEVSMREEVIECKPEPLDIEEMSEDDEDHLYIDEDNDEDESSSSSDVKPPKRAKLSQSQNHKGPKKVESRSDSSDGQEEVNLQDLISDLTVKEIMNRISNSYQKSHDRFSVHYHINMVRTFPGSSMQTVEKREKCAEAVRKSRVKSKMSEYELNRTVAAKLHLNKMQRMTIAKQRVLLGMSFALVKAETGVDPAEWLGKMGYKINYVPPPKNK